MAVRDDLENRWGVHLVYDPSRVPSATMSQFQHVVKQGIPNFQLHSFYESGTSANEAAVLSATNNDISRCLIAMGSYGGGEGLMFRLSSSQHSSAKQLSVISSPNEVVDENSRKQTVALPYYIPCAKYSDNEIGTHEKVCLEALNQKLFVAKLVGTPFQAILMELILCGTGGELSNNFLRSFGVLCEHYNVCIIVDEVMTGGRVGPNMTLASTTPTEFINQVKFITMGKFVGCGMLLTRVPKRPSDRDSIRGKSTESSPDFAHYKWRTVTLVLAKGMADERRQQVVDMMDCGVHENNWGKGCMIFTSRSRPSSTKGLKNRHLPRLENTKISKGTTKPTEWTRSTVCELLLLSGKKWIDEMKQMDEEKHPFVSCLCKYVLETEVQDITGDSALKFIGMERADNLAAKERAKRLPSRNCTMKAKAFVHEALGMINTHAVDLIKKTRVGSKRRIVYRLNREKLARW
jgi:hypothetical protein